MIAVTRLNKIVTVLIYYKHKILLQLRDQNKNIPYPGCWGFISGKLEIGETPATAARREVQEELLIKKLKNIKFLYTYLSRKKENIIHYVFKVDLNYIPYIRLKEGIECSFFSKLDFLKGYKFSKELKKNCWLAKNPVMKKFYFKSSKL